MRVTTGWIDCVCVRLLADTKSTLRVLRRACAQHRVLGFYQCCFFSLPSSTERTESEVGFLDFRPRPAGSITIIIIIIITKLHPSRHCRVSRTMLYVFHAVRSCFQRFHLRIIIITIKYIEEQTRSVQTDFPAIRIYIHLMYVHDNADDNESFARVPNSNVASHTLVLYARYARGNHLVRRTRTGDLTTGEKTKQTTYPSHVCTWSASFLQS